jgi:hypothetical protein
MAGSKPRTLPEVERDINRMKRAERKVRRHWNAVTRKLAAEGALVGMPVKGQPEPTEKPKLSVYVRHQREISKSLKICADALKALDAEKVALALQVAETKDEYDIS